MGKYCPLNNQSDFRISGPRRSILHIIKSEYSKNLRIRSYNSSMLACRVATNLENTENSGNLKNCQTLRKSSGKFEFLFEKINPGKLRENEKYVTYSPTKMHSIEFFSRELLREKFKSALEISGKARNLVSQKCGHPGLAWFLTDVLNK